MALIDNRSHGKNTGAVHTERVQYKDWSFDYILERILVEFGYILERFLGKSGYILEKYCIFAAK